MLGALPHANNGGTLTRRIVIGIGNRYRRDDGVGIVVADEVARQNPPGVRVITAIGEPGALLEAWSGIERAVVIDAAISDGLTPGRVQRWTSIDDAQAIVSSHALGLAQTYALGQALGRVPDELVVFTVDVVDTGNGVGLTSAVAEAVAGVVRAVLGEIEY